jgi:hypothetical protein
LIVSYLANLAGHHLSKAGFDGELTSFQNQKSNRVFTESEDGTQFNDEERFGMLTGPDQFVYIDPLTKKTTSLTVGGFLQDSWSVMDKVTVNLGMRYDAQYFYNTEGQVACRCPTSGRRAWASSTTSPRTGGRRCSSTTPATTRTPRWTSPTWRWWASRSCTAATSAIPPSTPSSATSVRRPDPAAQHQDDPRLPNKIFTSGGSTNAIDPEIQASSSDEISWAASTSCCPDARVGLTFTSAASTAGSRTCPRWRACPASTATPATAWARASQGAA